MTPHQKTLLSKLLGSTYLATGLVVLTATFVQAQEPDDIDELLATPAGQYQTSSSPFQAIDLDGPLEPSPALNSPYTSSRREALQAVTPQREIETDIEVISTPTAQPATASDNLVNVEQVEPAQAPDVAIPADSEIAIEAATTQQEQTTKVEVEVEADADVDVDVGAAEPIETEAAVIETTAPTPPIETAPEVEAAATTDTPIPASAAEPAVADDTAMAPITPAALPPQAPLAIEETNDTDNIDNADDIQVENAESAEHPQPIEVDQPAETPQSTEADQPVVIFESAVAAPEQAEPAGLPFQSLEIENAIVDVPLLQMEADAPAVVEETAEPTVETAPEALPVQPVRDDSELEIEEITLEEAPQPEEISAPEIDEEIDEEIVPVEPTEAKDENSAEAVQLAPDNTVTEDMQQTTENEPAALIAPAIIPAQAAPETESTVDLGYELTVDDRQPSAEEIAAADAEFTASIKTEEDEAALDDAFIAIIGGAAATDTEPSPELMPAPMQEPAQEPAQEQISAPISAPAPAQSSELASEPAPQPGPEPVAEQMADQTDQPAPEPTLTTEAPTTETPSNMGRDMSPDMGSGNGKPFNPLDYGVATNAPVDASTYETGPIEPYTAPTSAEPAPPSPATIDMAIVPPAPSIQPEPMDDPLTPPAEPEAAKAQPASEPVIVFNPAYAPDFPAADDTAPASSSQDEPMETWSNPDGSGSSRPISDGLEAMRDALGN